MANRIKFTDKKKERFCDVISKTGNVTAAAKVCGVSTRGAYDVREVDAEFRQNWDAAYESFLDNLEASLAKRGFEGVLEPVFYKGTVCGKVRKYSDTAAIAILNGRRSQIFRTKIEHAGAIEQRVKFSFGKAKIEAKKGEK